ncbi:FadR/GntR family transcriptional regulator [Mumia sp. Pv 4-285]|uniref:FadR/GntR family transcriptional regulator n=1 Tax=Mumia qirimensis TaxID=3234852 RepID=UPI00351D4F8B
MTHDRLAVPRSRAEHLADALERRIRDDGLLPGDALGTLDDLRAESGFSKPTVSEAVRLLRERGIVHIKPGRGGGMFVADHGPVVRLRRTLLTVSEDPSAIVDAIELRDHLEPLIDTGAARCRSDEDVRDLRRLLEPMRTAEDWSAFMRANWALHERIAAICPNAMARAVYVGTLGQLSSSSAHHDDAADGGAYRAGRLQVHVELVEAIASGDLDRVRAAVDAHHDAPR